MASAPGEYRKWLEEKLRSSNEPSFPSRVRELLDFVGDIAPAVVGDRRRLVRNIVDTRNHLTHHSQPSRPTSPDSEQLYWLQQRCGFLVQACLMRELGIPTDQIKELFEKNERYLLAGKQRK